MQVGPHTLCEHGSRAIIVPPGGVVVVGYGIVAIAAVHQQQRPTGAVVIEVRSAGIVQGHEEEVGCIIPIPIIVNAMECAERIRLGPFNTIPP